MTSCLSDPVHSQPSPWGRHVTPINLPLSIGKGVSPATQSLGEHAGKGSTGPGQIRGRRGSADAESSDRVDDAPGDRAMPVFVHMAVTTRRTTGS